MYIITFWGGPKDGTKLYLSYVPSPEVICADADTDIDPVEFYENICNHPLRTTKYHKYTLQKKKEDKKNKEYTYKFDGML